MTLIFTEPSPRESLQAPLEAWRVQVYPVGTSSFCRLLLPWPALVLDQVRVCPASPTRKAPFVEVARVGEIGAASGGSGPDEEDEILHLVGRLPGTAIATLRCRPGPTGRPGEPAATAALGRALQGLLDQRVAAALPLLDRVDALDAPMVLAQHLRLLVGGDPDQYEICCSSESPVAPGISADVGGQWVISLPVSGLAWTVNIPASPAPASALDAVRQVLLTAAAAEAGGALDDAGVRWGPAQVLEHDLRRRLEYLPLLYMASAARRVLDRDFPVPERERAADKLAGSFLDALPALRGLRGFLEALSVLGHRPDGSLDPGWLDPDRYPLASWPATMTDERWLTDGEYEPWLFAIKEFTDHPQAIVTEFAPEAGRRLNDRVLARLPPFRADDADSIVVSSAARYFFLAPAVEATRNAIRYLTTVGKGLPSARVRVDLRRGWSLRFEIENQVNPRKRFILSHTVVEMAHLFRHFPGLRLEMNEPAGSSTFWIRYEINLRGLKFRALGGA